MPRDPTWTSSTPPRCTEQPTGRAHDHPRGCCGKSRSTKLTQARHTVRRTSNDVNPLSGATM
eukprot:2270393-Prymnesium_polylepis.1